MTDLTFGLVPDIAQSELTLSSVPSVSNTRACAAWWMNHTEILSVFAFGLVQGQEQQSLPVFCDASSMGIAYGLHVHALLETYRHFLSPIVGWKKQVTGSDLQEPHWLVLVFRQAYSHSGTFTPSILLVLMDEKNVEWTDSSKIVMFTGIGWMMEICSLHINDWKA